jgi:hypothetical protein
MGASLLILLATLIAWPLSALVRRRYGVAFPLQGLEARAYVVVRVAAALSLSVVLAWLGTVMAMLANGALLSSTMDPWVIALRCTALIVLPLALAASLWNLWVVGRSRRGLWPLICATLLAVSLTVVLGIAIDFHLIGLGADY